MPRVILRLCAVLAALVAGLSNAVAAGLYNPKTFTLDNGLQVVLIEDHRAPVVTQMIWYRAGSADEKPGKSGIAHFLEHLMFKGTSRVPAGEFSATVSRYGGRENAFTSTDYTAYFQTVATEHLERMIELEADRMVNLTISAQQVDSERLVILEERRSRVDNSPAAQFAEQVQAAQFLAYPYRIPVIGWEHEMRALSREDALEWYRTHYAPNNAVLVIAGDITLDRLRPLVEKYYGPIPARPVPPRVRPDEPPQRSARRLEMSHQRVTDASWRRGYIAPSYGWGEKQHALPLSMLAEVLGGGQTSRLYRELVVEKKIATYAGSFYGAGNLGPSTFILVVNPVAGQDIVTIEREVEAIVADVIANGVVAEDLERARIGMLASTIYGRDSAQGVARLFGAALTSGRTIEDVESFPDRVEAVTIDQLKAAAKAVFDEARSVTGVLRPLGGGRS
jgi:zinc protease